MKKLFFIAMLFAVAISARSQTVYSLTVSADTLIDTATETLVSPISSYAYGATSLEFTATKVSGTVAGDCIVQGTISGANWQTLPDADTLTLANQTTNYKIWNVGTDSYRKYRVSCTGEGTMKALISGSFLPKSTK